MRILSTTLQARSRGLFLFLSSTSGYKSYCFQMGDWQRERGCLLGDVKEDMKGCFQIKMKALGTIWKSQSRCYSKWVFWLWAERMWKENWVEYLLLTFEASHLWDRPISLSFRRVYTKDGRLTLQSAYHLVCYFIKIKISRLHVQQ